jgi:hypothetical protein
MEHHQLVKVLTMSIIWRKHKRVHEVDILEVKRIQIEGAYLFALMIDI